MNDLSLRKQLKNTIMIEGLFRGKPIDKETIIGNDFYYGDLLHYANGAMTIRQPETGYEMEVIPETVGRFTGRKDIGGTRVFEGDKLGDNGDGIVVYDPYYCSFMVDFPKMSKKTYFEDFPIIDVNGTIHDQ